MKRTSINKVSKKQRAIKLVEAKRVAELLEQCEGKCMLCSKYPDWRGLSKNHTRDRQDFVLTCYNCHAPGGDHKYLEEERLALVKRLNKED